jgi:hypothetical protein
MLVTDAVCPKRNQTVFGDLESIQEIQPFKEGYGEGGFVTIKATKLD